MAKKQIKLKARQKRFCEEYVIDFDLARAWLKVGYKTKTRSIAINAASRFMCNNVYAQGYIKELLRGQKKRSEKSANDIVTELEECAFSNIEDFMISDENNKLALKSFEAIGRHNLAAMQSIQTETIPGGQKVKFKLHSKLHALELLGKRFKLFVDRHEHTGADGGPIVLQETVTVGEKKE